MASAACEPGDRGPSRSFTPSGSGGKSAKRLLQSKSMALVTESKPVRRMQTVGKRGLDFMCEYSDPATEFDPTSSSSTLKVGTMSRIESELEDLQDWQRRHNMPQFTGPFAKKRSFLNRVVHSQGWQLFVSMVMLVNSVAIGLELESARSVGEEDPSLMTIERTCLVIYILELAAQMFIDPTRLWHDLWVAFDAAIVVVGCLEVAFAIVDTEDATLGNVTVFRALRLLRLGRTIRLLKKVRVLWMMIKGLVDSFTTMWNTLLLLAIVMYLFSCLSMEIITGSELAVGESADPIFQSIVEQHFRSIPITMLTLIQFLTMDSIAAIYKPLTERQPWLILYFAGVILIVGIVILNLVTAVIVTDAMTGARKERMELAEQETAKRKRLIKKLGTIFRRLDSDGSGKVSSAEFLKLSDGDLDEVIEMTGVTRPLELFQMIDLDMSGELDIDEFCEGLWHVMVDQVPVETRRLQRRVELLYERMMLGKKFDACLIEALIELMVSQETMLGSKMMSKEMHGKLERLEDLLKEVTTGKTQKEAGGSSSSSKKKKKPTFTEVQGTNGLSVTTSPRMPIIPLALGGTEPASGVECPPRPEKPSSLVPAALLGGSCTSELTLSSKLIFRGDRQRDAQADGPSSWSSSLRTTDVSSWSSSLRTTDASGELATASSRLVRQPPSRPVWVKDIMEELEGIRRALRRDAAWREITRLGRSWEAHELPLSRTASMGGQSTSMAALGNMHQTSSSGTNGNAMACHYGDLEKPHIISPWSCPDLRAHCMK
eukprot:TRINITY_DN4278_c0_g1_i3.p1 TRINITY_DN4278_c0_g1~~TRINITY_DN4278_c0_g1_i3.p1  ORF type:complete len:772 (-),score=114.10 TRINITY_DN4278_c0_g1_i3:315-2630(-)